MKREHLTAKDLGLYFGCECMVGPRQLRTHVLAIHENGNIQVAHAEGSRDHWHPEEVKPILRRLESITEEERQLLSWAHSQKDPTCYPSTEFQYLLSISMDLFGWVDSELAIDQATLNQ